jgi:hypothetical protein
MIDDYQETMELLAKMRSHLPIPAYPSKQLVSALREQKRKIKTSTRLEIVDLHYLGDAGGITCVLELPSRAEAGYVVSLTHLRILPPHPLAKDIRRYQLHRIRNLAQQ